MCKSVPKCIRGLIVTEVRSASHSRRGVCPKDLGAWLGLKCMGKGWVGGMHCTVDTPLSLWSCLETDSSVYQLVSYMHVLANLIVRKAKWSGILKRHFPLRSNYLPAQSNFQQFSKLYLPTAYDWFHVSFGVPHGRFVLFFSSFFQFKHINIIHFLSETLSTGKK